MSTDIICTIGPKSQNEEVITHMAHAGMTILRNNFSHCTPEEYEQRLAIVKSIKEKTGRDIKILADLQGPRIRVKGVPAEGIEVRPGQRLSFVTNNQSLELGEIGVDDPYLHGDVAVGDQILIANGAIQTIVKEVMPNKNRIVAEVVNEGVIFPNKALNMPNTRLTTNSLTEKDKKDVEYLKTQPFDYVALSFVQSAADVYELRTLFGKRDIKVVVKIECQEALKNIDEIIEASDMVMVARGDLAVEVPYYQVPVVQKQLIRKCQQKLKPVVVATQMLLSMMKEPTPTRAEVSDVANAVFDGAHAVMLSDETANGIYPVESVQTMAAIVAEAEKFIGV